MSHIIQHLGITDYFAIKKKKLLKILSCVSIESPDPHQVFLIIPGWQGLSFPLLLPIANSFECPFQASPRPLPSFSLPIFNVFPSCLYLSSKHRNTPFSFTATKTPILLYINELSLKF